jgi:hypothetical protein
MEILLVIFGLGTGLYHLGVWRGRRMTEEAIRTYGTRVSDIERDIDELSRTVTGLAQ